MADDYLLDTNVLLRFCDASSPAHREAVDAVTELLARGDSIYVTAQNIIEFWAVATRPADANGFGWDVTQTSQEVARILNLFLFLDDSPAVFIYWLRLVTKHSVQGKQVHDARMAAVMVAHGVSSLLTFNEKDFARYTGVRPVLPSDVP